ncbi:MAG: ATP-binding cassette domain-containing protein [Thermoanaerobaculia bacterium]
MIEVSGLHFTYAGSDVAAVRGLDFTVERGEIFGFLGPSGAGKSTTQKILVGLLEGYTGHARVRGKEVVTWKADDYEWIGVSFETPNHFLKLTGLENLRYFAALYRRETRAPAALLEALGLREDGACQRVSDAVGALHVLAHAARTRRLRVRRALVVPAASDPRAAYTDADRRPSHSGQFAYAIAYPLLWIVLAYFWSRRALDRARNA